MIIRSKAPLRLGFAGGGTDLESYSNVYGGATFSAALSMFAYCTIIPTDTGRIQIYSADNKNNLETDSIPVLPIEGDNLILHRGVYNRIVKDFNGGKPLSFIMSTSNDAPVGSGLGTSSTMIVAILEAFRRWLNIHLDSYDMAQLAYDIERNDLGLAGGKQDQYSAVFGGFNLIEFNKDKSVVVHPLELTKGILNELECSLLLFYGGKSRKSAHQQLELAKNIIHHQIRRTKNKENDAIFALDFLKENAYSMRDCVIKADHLGFADCLRKGWEYKKKTSDIISNPEIEQTIDLAMRNGAEAVKVSGAGGGGFLLLYCNPVNRQKLIDGLKAFPDGAVFSVKFNESGVESWLAEN